MNVILRAAEPKDLDMMYRLENDHSLWAFSDTTVPYSRQALHRFIQTNRSDIYADRQVRLVVEIDGIPGGCADLYNVDARNLHAEVAIGLLVEYRSRGIGKEAICQLVDYATRHLGLVALTATTAASNLHARALFSAAGFISCACLKRWIRTGDNFDDAIIYQYNV